MKKIILGIVILFLFLFSCQKPRLGSWNDPEITGSNLTSYDGGEIKSIIYDSCEYQKSLLILMKINDNK